MLPSIYDAFFFDAAKIRHETTQSSAEYIILGIIFYEWQNFVFAQLDVKFF